MGLRRFWTLPAALLASLLIPPLPAAADSYELIDTVAIPGFFSFDIGWVDDASGDYYIAERTSQPNQGRVDVIDTETHQLFDPIGQFVGQQGSGKSGPNGILVVHRTHTLWAGDGNSHLKAYDVRDGSLRFDIDLGGKKRTDEIAYDPDHHLLLAANDADSPPFISIVSTNDGSIVKQVAYPQATDGIEQPAYDRATGLFLLAIPATTTNPGGQIDYIDPQTGDIVRTVGLTDCVPHGLVVGPRHRMLVGCSKERTLILSIFTGQVLANITQVGGSDEVWYNPGDHRYYTASSNHQENGQPVPVMGVINARTNTWITNVPTAAGAHSVAVSRNNNHIFIAVNGEGVRVYARTGDDGDNAFDPEDDPGTGE
jgi:hypothetical protein